MARAGRPTKYTPERQERICTALSAGNTRRAACAFAGIGETTFATWLDRYGDFREAVKKAEGDAEVRNVAVIARAAQSGTWQAAAWWLERRYPHDYGRTIQEQHHSGTITQEHKGAVEIRAVDYRIAAASLLTDEDAPVPRPPTVNGTVKELPS